MKPETPHRCPHFPMGAPHCGGVDLYLYTDGTWYVCNFCKRQRRHEPEARRINVNLNDLQRLHHEVWKWRARMAPVWSTPDRLDSARFAATEATEALNVILNQKGIYKRNNARDKDLYQELAQCALMLFTTLTEDCCPFVEHGTLRAELGPPSSVEWILFMIADALTTIALESEASVSWRFISDDRLLDALWYIAHYPGMDLERQLALAMGDLEAKWGPQSEHALSLAQTH